MNVFYINSRIIYEAHIYVLVRTKCKYILKSICWTKHREKYIKHEHDYKFVYTHLASFGAGASL